MRVISQSFEHTPGVLAPEVVAHSVRILLSAQPGRSLCAASSGCWDLESCHAAVWRLNQRGAYQSYWWSTRR